jgi:uncharacterized protein YjiK
VKQHIDNEATQQINGSFRHEKPACLMYNEETNYLVVVDAESKEVITVVKPNNFQKQDILKNENFGLDSRPDPENTVEYSTTLRLRGPKN